MGAKTQVTPRKAQAEETRRHILEVAIDAFSIEQYDDVAVSDIAAAAGVAHGLLFHYFKNKRGIYLAAMEEAAREWEAALEGDSTLPPGARMRQMYYNQLRYLAEHRGLAMRLVLGGRGADPEAWKFFEESRWRAIEWACTTLGLDPKVPALRMMLRTATAATDQAAAYWHEHGQPFDVRLLTDVLFEQTIAALRGAAMLEPSLDVDRAIELLRA
ncbi:MAG: TetR family transcriptional regulator [Rhodococcus sp. (in: high G+C Gram-positive bacteria)]|uniref:TetR/AcrR family transcriptional regulator n=1 Tax=Rhodococcus sp. TaxID=1831 RepID=UPI003BAF145E